ncbi:MAG: hypothetical protein WDM85_12830 [Caulobacteraceae bacterium]
MLAVALSLSHDAIVYIFEKEVGLLPRFRDRGHRHLSPLLNSRPLGHNFDPSVAAPEFRPPIFAWTKGRASDVAAQWLNEFDAYDRRLPIFTFRGCEVERGGVTASARGLRVKLSGSQAQHLQPVDVDLLIDATGFGEERNPLRVVDFSYWEAGHRLIYDHLATPATVLISGCGDSGVIEAFHYALKGFRHEDVEALWPYRGPDRYLDTGLERARLEHILKNGNLDDCDALPRFLGGLRLGGTLRTTTPMPGSTPSPIGGRFSKRSSESWAPVCIRPSPLGWRPDLGTAERFRQLRCP